MRFIDPYDDYTPRPRRSPVQELEEALDFAKRWEKEQKDKQQSSNPPPKRWYQQQMTVWQTCLILVASAPFTGPIMVLLVTQFIVWWKGQMELLLRLLQ